MMMPLLVLIPTVLLMVFDVTHTSAVLLMVFDKKQL